jgi:hypothetical protein
MDIEYTVHIVKEGAQYIAHAVPLDAMSSSYKSAAYSQRSFAVRSR